MKKCAALLLVFMMCLGVFSFAACNKNNSESSGSSDANNSTNTADDVGTKGEELIDDVMYQLQDPERGDEIAVIETSLGTIKIRLFPEEAPEAVQSFKDNVEAGLYTNTGFENVQKDMYMQFDAPLDEITNDDYYKNNLYHFRGAVSLTGDGMSTYSTRLTLVQASGLDSTNEGILQENSFGYNDDAIAKYQEIGGMPMFDGNFTVFGQIFQGLDVLDEIANQDLNDEFVPESVTILSVTVETY